MSYYNRIKNYLKGRKDRGIPGGFFEKIILDVFVKFFLELLAKILNPIIRQKKLRHKNLEKDRNTLLNHLQSTNMKYHSALETIIHSIYHTADHDIPYYQTYQGSIKCIQEKFPQRNKLSPYLHPLKSWASPKHNAEETDIHRIKQALESKKIINKVKNRDVSREFKTLINERFCDCND